MLESIFRSQLMDEACHSVDVWQFGAKGDGVTDDSAAFQAAVDSLNGGEGRIIFPVKPSDDRTWSESIDG
jgi:polygalacturonase